MYDLLTHGKQRFFFWPDVIRECSEVAIFGAGGRGREFSRLLKEQGVQTICFMDNDPAKQGTHTDGVETLSAEQCRERFGDVPVVIACFQHGKVFLQLSRLFSSIYYDFNSNDHLTHVHQLRSFEQRVKDDLELLEDEESRRSYLGTAIEVFNNDISYRYRAHYPCLFHDQVHIRPGDTVLALGANSGNYPIMLANHVGGDCMIHCFEPNYLYFPRLCKNILDAGHEDSAILHCAGAWSRTGIETLSDPFDMARGKITKTGKQAIYVWTVDDYVNMTGTKVDLIETECAGLADPFLDGAEKTVARYKPRLILKIIPGVCRVITRLKKLVPGYRFYYGDHDMDTKKSLVGFLYAIAE